MSDALRRWAEKLEAWYVAFMDLLVTAPAAPDYPVLDDQQLRLRAMELAVQWTTRTPAMTTSSLAVIADDIARYIRTGSGATW
ncbi:hypothetical protein HH308_06445 [Gordonia sp. TBRC 11910]|uniref:Uncharacterized protein n=1 Tax=Gordonia asplenii TaxID=2725283 RepID=A0A848KRG9_9ACTN|nr:hypothetical protein [Gordonia asplenii]NMO00852.1 hypothetical protein [Gordonia asplenii]